MDAIAGEDDIEFTGRCVRERDVHDVIGLFECRDRYSHPHIGTRPTVAQDVQQVCALQSAHESVDTPEHLGEGHVLQVAPFDCRA